MKLGASLRAFVGLGDAEGGTDHWWGQRISAIALIFLGLWFAYSLTTMTYFSHEEIVIAIGRIINRVLLLLLIVTTAYHSYLGIQVVIEDYVHTPRIRSFALLSSRFAHILLMIVALIATIMIGSGM